MSKRIGAIPVRVQDGKLSVLLISSKTRGRWVFPKGNREGSEKPEKTCSREAYEEGGIRGRALLNHPISAQISSEASGRLKRVYVTYYPLLVFEELDDWPESRSRRRRWVTLAKAARLLDPSDFKKILSKLGAIRLKLISTYGRHAAEFRD